MSRIPSNLQGATKKVQEDDHFVDFTDTHWLMLANWVSNYKNWILEHAESQDDSHVWGDPVESLRDCYEIEFSRLDGQGQLRTRLVAPPVSELRGLLDAPSSAGIPHAFAVKHFVRLRGQIDAREEKRWSRILGTASDVLIRRGIIRKAMTNNRYLAEPEIVKYVNKALSELGVDPETYLQPGDSRGFKEPRSDSPPPIEKMDVRSLAPDIIELESKPANPVAPFSDISADDIDMPLTQNDKLAIGFMEAEVNVMLSGGFPPSMQQQVHKQQQEQWQDPARGRWMPVADAGLAPAEKAHQQLNQNPHPHPQISKRMRPDPRDPRTALLRPNASRPIFEPPGLKKPTRTSPLFHASNNSSLAGARNKLLQMQMQNNVGNMMLSGNMMVNGAAPVFQPSYSYGAMQSSVAGMAAFRGNSAVQNMYNVPGMSTLSQVPAQAAFRSLSPALSSITSSNNSTISYQGRSSNCTTPSRDMRSAVMADPFTPGLAREAKRRNVDIGMPVPRQLDFGFHRAPSGGGFANTPAWGEPHSADDPNHPTRLLSGMVADNPALALNVIGTHRKRQRPQHELVAEVKAKWKGVSDLEPYGVRCDNPKAVREHGGHLRQKLSPKPGRNPNDSSAVRMIRINIGQFIGWATELRKFKVLSASQQRKVLTAFQSLRIDFGCIMVSINIPPKMTEEGLKFVCDFKHIILQRHCDYMFNPTKSVLIPAPVVDTLMAHADASTRRLQFLRRRALDASKSVRKSQRVPVAPKGEVLETNPVNTATDGAEPTTEEKSGDEGSAATTDDADKKIPSQTEGKPAEVVEERHPTPVMGWTPTAGGRTAAFRANADRRMDKESDVLFTIPLNKTFEQNDIFAGAYRSMVFGSEARESTGIPKCLRNVPFDGKAWWARTHCIYFIRKRRDGETNSERVYMCYVACSNQLFLGVRRAEDWRRPSPWNNEKLSRDMKLKHFDSLTWSSDAKYIMAMPDEAQKWNQSEFVKYLSNPEIHGAWSSNIDTAQTPTFKVALRRTTSKRVQFSLKTKKESVLRGYMIDGDEIQYNSDGIKHAVPNRDVCNVEMCEECPEELKRHLLVGPAGRRLKRKLDKVMERLDGNCVDSLELFRELDKEEVSKMFPEHGLRKYVMKQWEVAADDYERSCWAVPTPKFGGLTSAAETSGADDGEYPDTIATGASGSASTTIVIDDVSKAKAAGGEATAPDGRPSVANVPPGMLTQDPTHTPNAQIKSTARKSVALNAAYAYFPGQTKASFKVGDKIEVDYAGFNRWYEAICTDVDTKRGLVKVEFEDAPGQIETVSMLRVRKAQGAQNKKGIETARDKLVKCTELLRQQVSPQHRTWHHVMQMAKELGWRDAAEHLHHIDLDAEDWIATQGPGLLDNLWNRVMVEMHVDRPPSASIREAKSPFDFENERYPGHSVRISGIPSTAKAGHLLGMLRKRAVQVTRGSIPTDAQVRTGSVVLHFTSKQMVNRILAEPLTMYETHPLELERVGSNELAINNINPPPESGELRISGIRAPARPKDLLGMLRRKDYKVTQSTLPTSVAMRTGSVIIRLETDEMAERLLRDRDVELYNVPLRVTRALGIKSGQPLVHKPNTLLLRGLPRGTLPQHIVQLLTLYNNAKSPSFERFEVPVNTNLCITFNSKSQCHQILSQSPLQLRLHPGELAEPIWVEDISGRPIQKLQYVEQSQNPPNGQPGWHHFTAGDNGEVINGQFIKNIGPNDFLLKNTLLLTCHRHNIPSTEAIKWHFESITGGVVHRVKRLDSYSIIPMFWAEFDSWHHVDTALCGSGAEGCWLKDDKRFGPMMIHQIGSYKVQVARAVSFHKPMRGVDVDVYDTPHPTPFTPAINQIPSESTFRISSTCPRNVVTCLVGHGSSLCYKVIKPVQGYVRKDKLVSIAHRMTLTIDKYRRRYAGYDWDPIRCDIKCEFVTIKYLEICSDPIFILSSVCYKARHYHSDLTDMSSSILLRFNNMNIPGKQVPSMGRGTQLKEVSGVPSATWLCNIDPRETTGEARDSFELSLSIGSNYTILQHHQTARY